MSVSGKSGIDQETQVAAVQPLPGADRDLHFGRLAVQNGFVEQEALDKAITQQAADPSKSLSGILVQGGALAENVRQVIEQLQTLQLARQGNQPQQSPPSLPAFSTDFQHPTNPEDTVAFVPKLGGGQHLHKRFGDYELLAEIARGGMGVVYKARQVKLNRLVALKMIRSGELADEEQVKRFYAEAEAAATLDHSSIVPVYEVGQANSLHFFSMALIAGTSLNDRVKTEGPLPPQEAARLLKTVVEAVQYAHDKGIIHRDIKPQNILLDVAGNPRLTDFGLAKQIRGQSELTATGEIIGTPSYMPPEQAGGKVNEIGPASDVYSLGATLYFLLTGRAPFQTASVAQTIQQVLTSEPVALRRLNPAIPRDLETIALKCLAKEPPRRYASAKDLAQDLGRYLADQPILARPAGMVERAARWCRRSPWVAGLAAAVTISMSVGLGVSTALALLANHSAILARASEKQAKSETARANREQEAAGVAAQTANKAALAALAAEQVAEREKKVAQAERDRAEASLYPAGIQLADRAQRENNLADMQQRLESLQPSGDADRRGWEWYYLRGLAYGDRRTFSQHATYLDSVVWHPQGKLVASSSSDGFVKVWNADDGSEVASWQVASKTSCELAWNRSGERLLVTPAKSNANSDRDSKVLVWNLASGMVEFSQPGANAAWRPDGLRLAIAGKEGITLWNAETGKTESVPVACGEKSPLSWNGDGSQLAVADASLLKVLVVKAEGGEVQFTLAGHALPVTAIAFDRFLIATGGGDGVRTWEAGSGNPKHIFPKHDNNYPVTKIGWSQGGHFLAAAFDVLGSDNPNRRYGKLVKIWEVARGNLVRDHVANQFAWAPTGDRLAVPQKDRTIGIWRGNEPAPEQTVRGHLADIYALDWSPDGARLVSGSADVTAKVWSAVVPTKRIVSGHAAWQPGGKQLAVVSRTGEIELLDSTTWEVVSKLDRKLARVTALAWSCDGSQLAVGTHDQAKRGELLVWSVASGKEPLLISDPAGSGVAFNYVAFNSKATRVYVCGDYMNAQVRGYSVQTGEEVAKRQKCPSIQRIAWSPEAGHFAGSHITYKGNTHTSIVVIYDMESGVEKCRLTERPGDILGIAFDPAGNRLAFTAWHEDSQVGETVVWDLKKNERLFSFSAPGRKPACPAFHPTENRLAALVGTSVVLWDLVTGQELLSLDNGSSFLTWSADGRMLVANAESGLKVWDSSRGRERESQLPTEYFRQKLRVGGYF